MARPRKEREAPRIQRIELNEKNTRLRWILAGVLLVIGMAAFAIGVYSCVSAQSGWQKVESSADTVSCSDDFAFNYCYGQAGLEPTLERRQVVALYSDAVVKGYELFNTDVEGATDGLSAINAHPNEAVTVDKALYDALAQVVKAESRYIYLAPVYTDYDAVFRADSEVQAAALDPSKDGELGAFALEAATFAGDPAHISLELLEGTQVKLQVSQEYLAFVQEYAIDNLLDFGWMKNAFIIDYLAERMIADGHTNGYIASYDGYTRNLDSRGLSYSFNLFDRLRNDIYLPAVWEYDTAMSIVFLRNYPMSSRDSGDYYLYSDKTITHGFIDPADGICRTSTDNLVSYSESASCAQIALSIAPVFIGETVDTDALAAMTGSGIYSIWFDGGKLHYNQTDAKIELQELEGVSYGLSPVDP